MERLAQRRHLVDPKRLCSRRLSPPRHSSSTDSTCADGSATSRSCRGEAIRRKRKPNRPAKLPEARHDSHALPGDGKYFVGATPASPHLPGRSGRLTFTASFDKGVAMPISLTCSCGKALRVKDE